jgi:hypothetical protein
MMTSLNVRESIVEAAKMTIEKNIAWKSSSDAKDIHDWLEHRLNPTEPTTSSLMTTQPTTTTTTEVTSSSEATESSLSTEVTAATTPSGSTNNHKSFFNSIFVSLFIILCRALFRSKV